MDEVADNGYSKDKNIFLQTQVSVHSSDLKLTLRFQLYNG